MDVKGPKVAFEIPILGGIRVSETIVIGWIVIAIITILCLILTHNMKKVPSKRQALAEMLVSSVNNLVKETMGEKNIHFAPYIATIFAFSIFGSLISLTGLRPMTGDLNVTVCWALMTFILIQISKFKTRGFLGYFKSYTEPVAFITPLNIISEVATPISLAFRHFGNIAGGIVITSLLYSSLISLSNLIGIPIPIFAVGIPAMLSIYFDLFTGFMQAFIFIMLTMVFVGSATEE